MRLYRRKRRRAGGDVDPYKNYACLDTYLGTTFLERFFNYYRLEWGHDAAPADPKAPPSRARRRGRRRRETTPPYALHRMALWRHHQPRRDAAELGRQPADDGARQHRASVSWMNENHIQVYGWIDAGGNLSTNTVRGGNAPAAYDYNPNTVQLDQAVRLYRAAARYGAEGSHRLGLPFSPIYGENYRYTTAYRSLELPAPEEEQEQRLRLSDGLWRILHPAGRWTA